MIDLKHELFPNNDRIGVTAAGVLACYSIRGVIGPCRTSLAILFEPSLTRTALFAAVNHCAHSYEIASLDFRNPVSDGANFADNFVAWNTREKRAVRVNGAVPFRMCGMHIGMTHPTEKDID
jgi:hypothetical protein